MKLSWTLARLQTRHLLEDKIESVRIVKDAAVQVEPLDKLEEIFGGKLKIEVR